ncbi:DUF1499 domain-containing protein [Roseinatronobacter sp. S2]|uniref:DUF1499 domain-containing protein n=1 Tax=Roseinatronobacter sp. S2 TaxID=3035471 RepID=UPI00240F8947|nr:DUF1499 domain-containing protein [Roseinatronobacter sp. S2]WFE73479.1 DUF1499 domain-containing protein [Roseinatronobacter sp. S2]
MIKVILLILLLLAAGLMGYVWLAPSDPARWHEDPRLVARPSSPNFYLQRMVGGDAMPPVLQISAQDLAARMDRVATADGAKLIGGSVASGHMTYLTRSPVMGFPDYTSILIEPAGDGAMVLAFARARFGRSDMGANRARTKRWMKALQEEG